MWKFIFFFAGVVLLFSSCDEVIKGEDGDYIFKIYFSAKNIVFDLKQDGKCPYPIVIDNGEFNFFYYSKTRDRNNLFYSPPFVFTTGSSYFNAGSSYYDYPQYVLTKDCRLIAAVDGDSLDSNGEVSLDFKIINMISGDEAVVQGKYLPSDFKDSSECNSDGAYRVSEYPQIPVCFNSLPINETVEFEPPVSTDYLEEHIRDFYDKEYLNWQCIGD